jgi:hypothetical protein
MAKPRMTDAERAERLSLAEDIFHLQVAVHEFIGGEVGVGVITPLKMHLLVSARAMLAAIDLSQKELPTLRPRTD